MPFDTNTNTFTPASVSGYFPADLYNFGAPQPNYGQRSVKPYFQSRIVDKLPEGDIVAWKLLIEDTQGGLNVTRGKFDLDYDRVSSSTLDTRWFKTLVNHQLTSATTATVFSSNVSVYGVQHTMFNGLLHTAGGSTTNSALLKETSAADPTLAAVTYGPTSDIVSLTNVQFGANRVLAVGRSADRTQLLDTAYTPTNMHASLTGMWGLIQTFVNSNQWLVYYGTNIGTFDPAGAVGTLPTTTLSNVPSGGYGYGLVKLAGGPVRALWLWPFSNNETVAANGGRLVLTNQEGTDYQYVPMGLEKIYSAKILNDGAILATDYKRLMYYDGRSQARDLLAFTQRTPNSDREYRINSFAANGNEIICDVNWLPATGAPAGTYTMRWFESYNFETNAWHQISAPMLSVDQTASMSVFAPTGLPFSSTTRFVHSYVDFGTLTDGWHRMRIPYFNYNPYNMDRQTAGAAATTGVEFESFGSYTSPDWMLPGLDGCPSMVSKITYMGDVDAGGTSDIDAFATITAGNMSGTFITGREGRAQIANIEDNGDVFYALRVVITQHRNSGNTRWTPNSLPIMIEGYTWVPNMSSPSFGWYEESP